MPKPLRRLCRLARKASQRSLGIKHPESSIILSTFSSLVSVYAPPPTAPAVLPVHRTGATHVSHRLSHDGTFAAASGLTRILAPLHLGDQKLKRFLYVLVVSRRSLGPGAFELCGERAAVFGGDLALFGAQVGFVAYDYEGHPFDSLDCGCG